jgi:GDP-D-mannose 3',5'-epimerase
MKIENKKILVTGGAGFIGSHLVKSLISQNANVTVIDNLFRGKKDNLKNEAGEYVIDMANNFFAIDLTDYEKCLEMIRDYEFVIHLADVVGGISFVFDKEFFTYRQNIIINSNTLSACITNKVPNYIYVGTACSYPAHLQNNYDVVYLEEDQTYPANPESAYGWSKLMGEYEAALAQKNKMINTGLLRLHNVYGPGSAYDAYTGQVIPSLIRKAINYPKEEFIVWGSGEQYRDFIYIDDVIAAIDKVILTGMNKGLIQVGSGHGTSIREIAEKIKTISGKEFCIQFDNSAPEGDKGRAAILTKAKEMLDWEPKYSIDKGLQETYAWMQKTVNGSHS